MERMTAKSCFSFPGAATEKLMFWHSVPLLSLTRNILENEMSFVQPSMHYHALSPLSSFYKVVSGNTEIGYCALFSISWAKRAEILFLPGKETEYFIVLIVSELEWSSYRNYSV